MSTNIPGYTMGDHTVTRSPVSLAEFAVMQKSALFGDDDVKALRHAAWVESCLLQFTLWSHAYVKDGDV